MPKWLKILISSRWIIKKLNNLFKGSEKQYIEQFDEYI